VPAGVSPSVILDSYARLLIADPRPMPATMLARRRDRRAVTSPRQNGSASSRRARRASGAKTLSARLKKLEARRIVACHVQAGPPVRVLYSLTSKGRAFEEVAAAIERWGARAGRGRRALRRAVARSAPLREKLSDRRPDPTLVGSLSSFNWQHSRN
jgi:hypothetical protein